MNETHVTPLPNLVIRNKMEELWSKERNAYYAMFDELLANYEGKVVAIYQGRVVASGDNKTDVALDAISRFGSVPMYLTRITTEPHKVRHLSFSHQYRTARK
jgi:hypothetical protein